MKLKKWTSDEVAVGEQVMQSLAFSVGGLATTIPAFFVMIFLSLVLTLNYKVARDNGEPALLECGVLGFACGVVLWIGFFIAVHLF